jgi:hypothetical protein
LKLFRRSAHLASMIAPLLLACATLAAQSQPTPQQQEPAGQNQVREPERGDGNQTVTVTVNQPAGQPQQNRPRLNQSESDVASRRVAAATIWIAVFTLVLVVVGGLQWWTYKDTLAATKVVERAYVSLSHVQPGLDFVEHPTGQPFDIRATVRITNNGNTPADILGFAVTFAHGGGLVRNPARPPAPNGDPLFCLMPRDHIDLWNNFTVTSEVFGGVRDEHLPGFLIGWIVYRDRFGQRHRSGYARQYFAPGKPGDNNLLMVVGAEYVGYNYEEDVE